MKLLVCHGTVRSTKKPCKYKCAKDTDYCQLHQKQANYDEENVRCSKAFCDQITILPYKQCLKCRKQQREDENKRRLPHEAKCAEMRKKGIWICKNYKCGETFEPFKNRLKRESLVCRDCYGYQCEIEANRPFRNRDWKLELLNNPDRAAKRIEYIKNQKLINPERFRKYWMDFRNRLREKLGIEGYRKRNAEQMRRYREQNRDRWASYHKEYLSNTPEGKLSTYKTSSKNKGKEWLLTDAEAFELFHSPCFYCGYKKDGKLNGIDKIIFDGHYATDNSVPCCFHCNVMKGCLDIDVFILRCIHISAFKQGNGCTFESLYPAACYDSEAGDYNRRATGN